MLAWLPVLGVGLIVVTAVQDLSVKPLLWREAWGVVIVLALAGGLSARSIAAALAETPTVPIASAAGYVALQGKAEPLPGPVLEGPSSRSPCVWYRYHYTSDHHRRTAETTRPFVLADPSGRCLVMPAGAEVDAPASASSEALIVPGTELYVIGHCLPAAETPARFDDPRSAPGPLFVRVTSQGESHAADRRLDDLRRALAAPIELPRVPSIGLPADGRPFRIGAAPKAADAAWYRTLALVDLAIFIAGLVLLPFTELQVL